MNKISAFFIVLLILSIFSEREARSSELLERERNERYLELVQRIEEDDFEGTLKLFHPEFLKRLDCENLIEMIKERGYSYRDVFWKEVRCYPLNSHGARVEVTVVEYNFSNKKHSTSHTVEEAVLYWVYDENGEGFWGFPFGVNVDLFINKMEIFQYLYERPTEHGQPQKGSNAKH